MLQFGNSPDFLLEENEAYFYHRHAFAAYQTTKGVMRRNYCYGRNYPSLTEGAVEGTGPGGPFNGQDCLVAYPSSNITFENNIAEGPTQEGITIRILGLLRLTNSGVSLRATAGLLEPR
jgi:hypothetical protein